MYLLDTNIISELRRVRPHGAVLSWLKSIEDAQLHLSAMTIGELQRGIKLTADTDPERAEVLQRWLLEVEATWNVLPMTSACFRRWAQLMHHRSATYSEDAMIAATALTYGLTVVTRNVRDFDVFGIAVLNPFTG